MPTALPVQQRNARVALVQLVVLMGLFLAAFRTDLGMFQAALSDSQAAHALAAPLIIGILLYWRRHELSAQLTGGSPWGVAVLLGALTIYFFSLWPFNFGYPRRTALVLAMAGIVFTVGGWRVLKLCLAMLLVLLIAIPTGPRYYAFLTIKPETVTLEAARVALDLLPGVFVDLNGPDLSYFGRHGSSTIALGEPFRGASLYLAMVTIGVFVSAMSIRPWWQHAIAAVAAVPIALFCNFVRLCTWGVITIYGGAVPLNPIPRMVSTVLSLVLAYGLFVAVLAVASRVFIEPRDAAREDREPAAVET